MAASRELIGSVRPEEIPESVKNARVDAGHFERALEEVPPSYTEEMRRTYERIEERFARLPEEADADDEQVQRTFH